MTKKILLFITAVILGISIALFALVTFGEVRTYGDQVAKDCGNGKPAHTQLIKSAHPALKKLAQYEHLCKGAVVDQLMVFLPMPTTSAEATSFADDAAGTLREFSKHGIAPLVLFEPSQTIPTVLRDMRSGHYDDILKQYYQRLHSHSVTSSQMGTWVLFPEANTPVWGNTDPDLFQANVTKVATLQKQYFPTSNISILLNSRSHPSDDSDWNKGQVTSLVPYLDHLPKGLLDSFGYQGFPSQSAANAATLYSSLQPGEYLPVAIAQQAVDTLGVSKVWLNTGTYATMYASQPSQIVHQSPQQRRVALQGVLDQALAIRRAAVSVNIFAEDKSDTAEAVDWSYWHGRTADQSPDTRVLTDFIATLQQKKVGFSLYDNL